MVADGGANLDWVEWGRGDAPRVALLVHGLTGRAEAFEALVEELDPAGGRIPGGAWRFLAPDLRGRGASRGMTEGEGGIPEHARDLLALLDREGLEKVVFVGHSLGAMIGVHLAAEHPERLSGLVLVDGGADLTEGIRALTSPAVERLEQSYSSREAYVEHVRSLPIWSGTAGTSAWSATLPGTCTRRTSSGIRWRTGTPSGATARSSPASR